ncbi:imp4 family u3 small nucleolar ribonucleoprotein [Cyclospora cayetanensis]|uniref:Imp4 family u3 small nucleolar ribonucleoprotein n=1 Tax=Cyclospora cayetanensis TaxID=88456 RepID=A0A1D3CRW8_9EIME|nr:imp4 family u3 small nucleolar ribonucleoprotein [Cyclospora cayetanensis]
MAKRQRASAGADDGGDTPDAGSAPPKLRKVSDHGSGKKKDLKAVDPSKIRNKARRAAVRQQQKQDHKKEKSAKRKDRKRREKRGETVEKQVPRTIESMRAPDDSVVSGNDAEAAEAEEADEFAPVFRGEKTPKLFITTSKRPSARFHDFLKEMLLILPGAYYYKRLQTSVKTVCSAAIAGGFTAVLLFKEKKGQADGLYICHLPEGPTSYFRISNVTLAQDLPDGGCSSSHNPELLLNNFVTSLGRRVARLLGSLFPVVRFFARLPSLRWGAALGRSC